jgi:hypothetical protein
MLISKSFRFVCNQLQKVIELSATYAKNMHIEIGRRLPVRANTRTHRGITRTLAIGFADRLVSGAHILIARSFCQKVEEGARDICSFQHVIWQSNGRTIWTQTWTCTSFDTRTSTDPGIAIFLHLIAILDSFRQHKPCYIMTCKIALVIVASNHEVAICRRFVSGTQRAFSGRRIVDEREKDAQEAKIHSSSLLGLE